MSWHCYCQPCYNEWRRAWRWKNHEHVLAKAKRDRLNNHERAKEIDRKSYYKNRLKRIAKSRRWNVENKERFAAREAARRAAQKSATPSWVDPTKMEAIYAEAAQRSSQTGTPHHVDHIVPLKNNRVCGLHVPWNLQVLTAFENQSKNNRHWPGM